MDLKSIFCKKETKKTPILIKIIIVCVFLSIVLIALIIYSSNLSKDDNNKANTLEKNTNLVQTPVYDHDKLVSDYKDSLQKYLREFNGDYSVLKNKIVDLNNVPAEYQKLHFNLVITLDSIIYDNSKLSAADKLQTIADENEWLKPDLQKLIDSLK